MLVLFSKQFYKKINKKQINVAQIRSQNQSTNNINLSSLYVKLNIDIV